MNRRLNVSALALFGALGLTAFSGVANAIVAVDPLPACPGAPVGSHTSAVTSAVTDVGGGTFAYDFRVCNTSNSVVTEQVTEVIRDWELPYFGSGTNGEVDGADASQITNVRLPEGWNYSIETIGQANVATGWGGVADWQTDGDPLKAIFDAAFGGAANNPYNTVTHVLHFYTGFCEGSVSEMFCSGGDQIVPMDFRDGFGFDSPFGQVDAPYQASWTDLRRRTGDPAFPLAAGPDNPILQAALNGQPVPEPGSLALLGLGLAALRTARRKKAD